MAHGTTKEYRQAQLQRLSRDHDYNNLVDGFKPKLKITRPHSETNWLDITNKELLAIEAILTR